MKTDPLPAFLIGYSDSSFTNPHEVVLPGTAGDFRGRFTHMGAQYSGFESRRHRTAVLVPKGDALVFDHNAHDWLRIGLKQRAKISEIHISTKWFTGNHVRTVTVYLYDEMTGKKKKILDRSALSPDSDHRFEIKPFTATECLVECYYDGGIARVHLFGEMDEQMPQRANILEQARISHISNDHYGKPAQAVAGDRKEMHMVGWESARSGFGERALFHLAQPIVIGEIAVDTYMHRLNAPLSCHVFGTDLSGGNVDDAMRQAPRWKITFSGGHEVIPDDFAAYMREQKYLLEPSTGNKRKFKISLHNAAASLWKPILPFAKLSPDTFHRFGDLENHRAVTHVLYMHYPNGGIHALRMYAAGPQA